VPPCRSPEWFLLPTRLLVAYNFTTTLGVYCESISVYMESVDSLYTSQLDVSKYFSFPTEKKIHFIVNAYWLYVCIYQRWKSSHLRSGQQLKNWSLLDSRFPLDLSESQRTREAHIFISKLIRRKIYLTWIKKKIGRTGFMSKNRFLSARVATSSIGNFILTVRPVLSFLSISAYLT